MGRVERHLTSAPAKAPLQAVSMSERNSTGRRLSEFRPSFNLFDGFTHLTPVPVEQFLQLQLKCFNYSLMPGFCFQGI